MESLRRVIPLLTGHATELPFVEMETCQDGDVFFSEREDGVHFDGSLAHTHGILLASVMFFSPLA